MTPRDLALRLAVLKVLTTELGNAKKAADCEIRDGWRPKDRITATLPGDKDVGTVTLASGKTMARLTDEAAYEKWVRENHDDQIEVIEITRVRPDFTDRLMAAARKLGVAVDADTGEEVPGITVLAGDPYPMVKLADDAREQVAKAWRSGELAELLPGLLEIEGGE